MSERGGEHGRRRRSAGRRAAQAVLRAAVTVGLGFVATVAIAWLGAAYSIQPGRRTVFTPEVIDAPWTAERFKRVVPAPRGYEYEFETDGLAAHEALVSRERVFAQLVASRAPSPLLAAPTPTPEDDVATATVEPNADGMMNLLPNQPRKFGDVRLTGRAADRYLAGWPMRALEWTNPDLRHDLRQVKGRTRWDDAWDFGMGYGARRAAFGGIEDWRGLPVRPVGRGVGLIVDTGVWSAAAAGALWAPGIVRRRRRHGRGQCSNCGYPVRDASGRWMERCPECGLEVGEGRGSGA